MTPVRVATAVLAAAFAVVGLWALVEARSFYEVAAQYEPFNPHFIHDIGAFALGLAGCLAAALVVRDGLLAALLGATAFGVAHSPRTSATQTWAATRATPSPSVYSRSCSPCSRLCAGRARATTA